MKYFNIRELKGFTLGKEYTILDQRVDKMLSIEKSPYRVWMYVDSTNVSELEDRFDYNDKVSANNGYYNKKKSKVRKERFTMVDDFGKNRTFSDGQIKMMFTSNSDDVISLIRDIKLNKFL